jgi:hypothetical protein
MVIGFQALMYLKGAVSHWLEEQDNFCFPGISSLSVKWMKYVKIKGDCTEKQ